MDAENRTALKEWAAVTAAIAAGEQTILLRKGGISERRGDFEVERREFWLFPTRFHQDRSELSEQGGIYLNAADAMRRADEIPITLYATVAAELEIRNEHTLPLLRPFHVLADRTVANRFIYRSLGLTVLVIRAYQLPLPIRLPDSPHFSGCKSWVDLPRALPTSDLTPVIDDERFQLLLKQIRDSAAETCST